MSLPATSCASVVHRTRILIVDDEPVISAVVAHMLQNDGFEACCLQDSDRILPRVEETRPDLVIMDYEMPGLSGPEAAIRLKSDPATRGIPIVFLSGYTDSTHRMTAAFSGSVAFLAKPVNKFALLGLIHRIIGVSKGASS
jgi:CheY-like chemotaxis protein